MPETPTDVNVRSATPTKQLVIERTLKASPERSLTPSPTRAN
jgi:hypothetical protein